MLVNFLYRTECLLSVPQREMQHFNYLYKYSLIGQISECLAVLSFLVTSEICHAVFGQCLVLEVA